MVESGDWVVPSLRGAALLRQADPVLLADGRVPSSGLGPGAGAARLVPVAASIGVLLATVWLGTLLFDRRSALARRLVLATTLAFLSFGRVAMSDMLLTLWSRRWPSAWPSSRTGPGAPSWPVPLLGAVVGLGFATKGPVAAPRPRPRRPAADVGEPAPAVPCGVGARSPSASSPSRCSALGWFVLVYRRLGRGRSSPSSSARTWSASPARPTTWAGPSGSTCRPTSPRGCPWSPFLPIALAAPAALARGRRGARTRFLAAWVALVLVPLSLSRGKIDYYLLPLYPGDLPRDRTLLRRRALERRATGPGPASCWSLEAAALALLLALPPRIPAPSGCPAALAAGAPGRRWSRPARCASLAVAVRPTPRRAAALLASVVAAAWLVRRRLVPAGLRRRPAQPRDRGGRGARAALPARPADGLLLRPDPRAGATCCSHVRLAAFSECDLWSLAGSREPFLLLATPAQDASFRVDPRYREIARYRYVPASALTLGGLFSLREPGEVVLGANFATTDPEAERKKKREYRKALGPASAGRLRRSARGALERSRPRPRGTPRRRRRPSGRSRPRRGRARRTPPRTARAAGRRPARASRGRSGRSASCRRPSRSRSR